MTALARTQSSSCADPKLDVFTSINGFLTDVAILKFQIWDKSTGTPVQVYPDNVGGKADVDVSADCPTGDRLALGRYVARYTVPADANIGTFQVRWYIQLTPSITPQVFIEEFEVLPEIVGAGSFPDTNYCMVADMREEGVPSSVTDAFLLKRINLASRFVERVTRRWFYPKPMTIRLDGTGGAKLLLSDPIIGISKVTFEISPLYPDEFTVVETDIMRVYNRHLVWNLTEPDDRNSPKIELFNPGYVRQRNTQLLTRLAFPIGQQNVQVEGVFGYTDSASGTPPYSGAASFDPARQVNVSNQGVTPDLIRHVTKLLVIRELPKMANVAARFDARNRFRLTSERTRDQAYTLEGLAGRWGAFFTGDPEIDNILAYYQRPPAIGAA